MRNLVPSLVIVGCLSIAAAIPAKPHTAPVLTAAAASESADPVEALPDSPPTTPEMQDQTRQELARLPRAFYLVDVMNNWPHAVSKLPAVEYSDVARDIAAACTLPEDGVLLAGLGYWEGARYAAYVDDGRCNDPEWRKSDEGRWLMLRWGDCDGGKAFSMWQIHPIVDKSSKLYGLCSKEKVTRSRVDAARCALEIARSSMTATGDLRGYTGEIFDDHPKADQRLEFIRRAIAKHPFRLPKQ